MLVEVFWLFLFSSIGHYALTVVDKAHSPATVKLLCLSAVGQSFLVDSVIFSATFSGSQVALGSCALALSAVALAVSARNDERGDDARRKDDEQINTSYLTRMSK